MKGRRLPVVDGQPTWPEQAGDYCGPVVGHIDDKPAVFFLKPNARDKDAPPHAHVIHHVVSPPHVFTEHKDGTLSIRQSLGDMHDGQSDGWHGFLTAGEWHLEKREVPDD